MRRSGNLLIQKFGIGVVDDTLQQFAESGKFLVVQAVEHMNVGFDEVWTAWAVEPFPVLPRRRSARVW